MIKYSLFIAMAVAALVMFMLGCESEEISLTGPFEQSPDPAPDVDYDNLEAVHLCYQVEETLLPRPEYYYRIKNEVRLIRDSFPDMVNVHHLPKWVAGELLVKFTQEAVDSIEAGQYHGLDYLKDEYGEFSLRLFLPELKWGIIEFELPYNSEVMLSIVIQSDDVEFAEPNYYVGDGDYIYVNWPRYTFSKGWGDCPSGCIYRHYYEYYVNQDTVILVRDYGD